MVSNVKPRGGTSRLSMLPGAPSQCTRQPLAQGFGHGQAREDVAAGAAGHDQCAAGS